MTYRFVTSIRGSLCNLIYTKTLDLSSTALDESVAVSLMSTDTESICQSAATLHELWASPIESAVAIFLLYRQLGLAALAPVVVAIIDTTSMLQLAQFIGMAKRRWMRGIQTRVDVTASVLTSMKEVKMLGLSDIVANMIQNLRVTELDLSKQYRRLLAIQTFIGRLPLSKRDNHPSQDDEKGDTLVAISGATFGWVPGKPDILNDTTFNIRRSCFTFIFGPVGSGKSTLMRAILGEAPLRAGFIHADPGNIAFVGQEPWIQNLTIRQNILGRVSYDAEWYSKVVYTCGLEQDIGELPDGDATMAGSAGFSLSGGKKQRLALARAVYSREKIVLLDDVFAGQDTATEEHVFQNLFAETGLFRQMSITVVCVTNAIHRLAYADHVVALDYRHKTVPKGRYENDAGQNSDNSESAGQVLGEFATYAYYFGSVPVWHTILFASLIILYAGGDKMTALVLSFWTDTGEEPGQATNDYYLGLFGMLTGLAVLGITGTAYFYLVVMVPLSSEVLHARLLHSVMNAPVAFFSRTDVGVTTNRFSQDMSVVDTELPFAFVDLCVNFSLIIMSVILMCVFSGYFAATIVPFVAFCWLLQKFYVRTSRQIRLFDLEAKSLLFTQFFDLFQGLSTVRAFAWGPRFIERYLDLLDASQRPFYLLFCIQRWLGLLRAQLSAHGHVIIKDLVASYDARSGGEPVLRGVSLGIPAGAKVGICGRSGSGKSSLLGCTLRLLEVGPGSRITIDGVGITTLPQQTVRAAVAVVPQHPFFLKHTSLRDNLIVLHRQQQQTDDDKILQVLRRLKMDDIVDRLGGLDSLLDADQLSQGQRQLLCIARAMLADKRIILIDEASSNVDERSERLIRDIMREQFASCTVIAVAHRLGAVVDFDRVAVMGGGRLLEWDSPHALLKRDSEFKRLWHLGGS
ncbi:hypothetical protein N7495_002002 [Penicillium taxi]|uniref:uncharacterized protein n=1 Tax=Penicillium taxi TaxID=168475 RepID=UPI00254516C1|nr:uncharacterized protein N7495_002002 [Penicillium taxi]KAJ5901474.1 hypothetical protein N7495_002002 [Penicillium taxi]